MIFAAERGGSIEAATTQIEDALFLRGAVRASVALMCRGGPHTASAR
jgi:hypothetical protein